MLLATVLGSAVTAIDATVVGIALPSIGTEFGTGLAALQWVVTAYTLTLAGFLLAAGALGTGTGGGASLSYAWSGSRWRRCCAHRPGRAVADRGAGAAGRRRGTAHAGQSGDPSGVIHRGRPWPGHRSVVWSRWCRHRDGPVPWRLAGPVSWRLIFYINLPIAVAVVAIAARHVPESCDAAARGRVDFSGAMLVTVGLVGLTFGLIEGPAVG